MTHSFRLTLIRPCLGRRPGKSSMRSWQMEPLPLAVTGEAEELWADVMDDYRHETAQRTVKMLHAATARQRTSSTGPKYADRALPTWAAGVKQT